MMRRSFWLVAGLALTVALLGCGGSGTEQSGEQVAPQGATERSSDTDIPEPVRKAVAVARKIEAAPDALEAILEQHELTPETFEDLMYEISIDPELSKAYEAALN